MAYMQSVVIYRSPEQQALWESGAMYPMLCVLLAILISYIVAFFLIRKIIGAKKMRSAEYRNVIAVIITVACAAAGYFTFTYMPV